MTTLHRTVSLRHYFNYCATMPSQIDAPEAYTIWSERARALLSVVAEENGYDEIGDEFLHLLGDAIADHMASLG